MLKKAVLIIFFLSLISGCSTTTCEENAKKLVQNKITLYEHDGWRIRPFKWKDGIEVSTSEAILRLYHAGSGTGQNINVYYPEYDFPGGLNSEQNYFSYSKQVIDGKGNILGNNEFEVRLYLKPIPGTEGSYQPGIVAYKTLDFEVIDQQFVSCQWTG